MLRLLSWNIAQRDEPWGLVASSDVDVALLQEAKPPPEGLGRRPGLGPDVAWQTAGCGAHRPWRALVAQVSDRVAVRHRACVALQDAGPEDVGVSRLGTLAVADVTVHATGETVSVASVYAAWEVPLPSTGSRWIFADASVHRVISDLSVLVGRERGHSLIVAGDWNVLRGYGEHSSRYWKRRYESVFERMDAIGVPFAGPVSPDGGAPSLVRPDELPPDSTTVPTFRTRLNDPRTATRQLDFVFASACLHPRLRIRALNGVEEWGPSDHCRIQIDLLGEKGNG